VKGYAPKEKTQILKRLELVELRGRNKQKFWGDKWKKQLDYYFYS
jgi:hypothetical protein